MTTLSIATADSAPSNNSQSCADTQAETGEAITPTTISDEVSSEESSDEEPVPLPLEVFIPEDHLPDVLEVYDTDTFRSASWYNIPSYKRMSDAVWKSWAKFLARCPIKFVRESPWSSSSPLHTVCDVLDHGTIGQLDLRRQRCLGSGNHSYVFLAPLTLPPCEGQALRAEVAVKLTRLNWWDLDMLKTEVAMFEMFPRELQESTPSSPPVVPRFYGCYAANDSSVDSYKDADGDEEAASIVRTHVLEVLGLISDILLLEPCGKPIEVETLSTSNKDMIAGLYDRLHNAKFLQGSVGTRNVLVQPGPLTCPRAERSFDNPSYRIIDFGRGECYNGFDQDFTNERMGEEQKKVHQRICKDVV